MSPDLVGQMKYIVGQRGGAGGQGKVWMGAGGGRELYVSFWLKLSSNWRSQCQGTNKILYFTRPGAPTSPLIIKVWGGTTKDDNSGLVNRLTVEGQTQNGTTIPNRSLKATVSRPEIVRGRWHHWEVYAKVGTPTTHKLSDGVLRLWVDGQLAIDYSDVAYNGPGQLNRWSTVEWSPIWGGGRCNGVRQILDRDQEQFIDHLYISKR